MTQNEALAVLKTGTNVFLTGEPGSGKTRVIQEFTAWLRTRGIEPSVTASTGIAATQIGGTTFHAWSGIGTGGAVSAAKVEQIASREMLVRRLTRAQVLIVEEVSMLSAEALDLADRVCREARRVDRPFGGLTLVFVGDFFQLPPVSRERVRFAYESDVWKEARPVVCYLTEQHRQDDREFSAILCAIRSGRVEPAHHNALAERLASDVWASTDAPRLFSHNEDVDRINAEKLATLRGSAKKFFMTTKGKDALVEGLVRGCLSPRVLELKKGAAVMFTKNSLPGGFVNGTLGTVTGFRGETPVVKTRAGKTILAEPATWQVEEEGKVRASITQIPLRLAYAMTVHKSQGMSMDRAVIDLSRAFEYGQGYVALSRVRRLAGVFLTGMNEHALAVHPEILEKDADFRLSSAAAREVFSALPAVELAHLHERFALSCGGA